MFSTWWAWIGVLVTVLQGMDSLSIPLTSIVALHRKANITCDIVTSGYQGDVNDIKEVTRLLLQKDGSPLYDVWYNNTLQTAHGPKSEGLKNRSNIYHTGFNLHRARLSKNAAIASVRVNISNVHCSDSGVYSCKADYVTKTGKRSTSERNIELHVRGGIEDVTLRTVPDKSAFSLGEKVTSTCYATTLEYTKVSWYAKKCSSDTHHPKFDRLTTRALTMEEAWDIPELAKKKMEKKYEGCSPKMKRLRSVHNLTVTRNMCGIKCHVSYDGLARTDEMSLHENGITALMHVHLNVHTTAAVVLVIAVNAGVVVAAVLLGYRITRWRPPNGSDVEYIDTETDDFGTECSTPNQTKTPTSPPRNSD